MKASLRALIAQGIDALRSAGTLPADTATPDFVVERPKTREHGDFATNAAMLLAKAARSNPRAIATALVAALPASDDVAKVEIAGPGFINFHVAESAWRAQLAQVLSQNPQRWTVVSYHHPMFSVSQGRDNPRLRHYWQPLFEQYGVDLALQGHDHVYGRQVAPGISKLQKEQAGTVYLVSVAGPKMYLVADQAQRKMQKVAEDTQLLQLLDFGSDVLRYQSFTVSGKLYDSFELQRQPDGSKQLLETDARNLLPQRRCGNPQQASAEQNKCWEGDDFGLASKANR